MIVVRMAATHLARTDDFLDELIKEMKGIETMKPSLYRLKRRVPEEVGPVEYTNVEQLQRYLTDGGRIVPRRVTGHSLKRHREIARAIKRARHIGLLPFGKSFS